MATMLPPSRRRVCGGAGPPRQQGVSNVRQHSHASPAHVDALAGSVPAARFPPRRPPCQACRRSAAVAHGACQSEAQMLQRITTLSAAQRSGYHATMCGGCIPHSARTERAHACEPYRRRHVVERLRVSVDDAPVGKAVKVRDAAVAVEAGARRVSAQALQQQVLLVAQIGGLHVEKDALVVQLHVVVAGHGGPRLARRRLGPARRRAQPPWRDAVGSPSALSRRQLTPRPRHASSAARDARTR